VRLFVALDIDRQTRSELRRVRERFERLLASARRAPRVTWVAEDVAHVTLRFIGEVTESTAESIRDVLTDPIPVAPYDLQFAGLGAFPDTRRPRVLWIGASAGSDETAQLAEAMRARLDPVVGPDEPRPFRVHLTVGRVKEGPPFDWEAAFRSIDVRPTTSRIDHVTLYQSRTSPKGPTYTALCETPLRADPGE
jgi:2'-5' RNA ligase